MLLKRLKRWTVDRIWHSIYRLRFGKFRHLGAGVRMSLRSEIKYASNISIGSGSLISEHCYLRSSSSGHIILGRNAYIGPFSTVMDAGGFIEAGDDLQLGGSNFVTGQGGLRIGHAALIAPMVSIVANQHLFTDLETPVRYQPENAAGIEIGDNGWIGVGAAILDGVQIGDHVVIGANAVVTKDIPSYSVAAGIPAKVMRKLQ